MSYDLFLKKSIFHYFIAVSPRVLKDKTMKADGQTILIKYLKY